MLLCRPEARYLGAAPDRRTAQRPRTAALDWHVTLSTQHACTRNVGTLHGGCRNRSTPTPARWCAGKESDRVIDQNKLVTIAAISAANAAVLAWRGFKKDDDDK